MFKFFKKQKKQSEAYCKCGHNILGDKLSLVYENLYSNNRICTNIICSKCGIQSKWNLDAPVPLFLGYLEIDKSEGTKDKDFEQLMVELNLIMKKINSSHLSLIKKVEDYIRFNNKK